MRDPKKRAKGLAIYWLNKCYDLGLTAEEIVAESVVTTSAVTTVTKKEKRDIPPTPPIERKEKSSSKKTSSSLLPVGNLVDDAGVSEVIPSDPEAVKSFVAKMPNQATFLAWCKVAGVDDIPWAVETYELHAVSGWMDERGNILTNWPKYFKAAYTNYQHKRITKKGRTNFKGAYKALPDDERVMFDAFWAAYPSRRRVEKDKCASKFHGILHEGDAVSRFNAVMEGLEKWKQSFDWKKLDGEYVMMPYRWLLNEYWAQKPGVGKSEYRKVSGVSQTANVKVPEEDITW